MLIYILQESKNKSESDIQEEKRTDYQNLLSISNSFSNK